MIVKRIIVGPIETNCYLIGDEKNREAAIIDPGDDAGKILNVIKENNLKPRFILLTHEHPDHIGALEEIKEKLDLEILSAKNGDKLKLGNLKIKVIATPGHSKESICFIIEHNIFSGDTLFKGGIGRTDFGSLPAGRQGGDFNQIQKSLKRLMQFPDDFKVFSGHGPETTIGEERKNNPFL